MSKFSKGVLVQLPDSSIRPIFGFEPDLKKWVVFNKGSRFYFGDDVTDVVPISEAPKVQELIEALKAERQKLGKSQGHDGAIKYLTTGQIDGDTDKNDLLSSIVHDFESTYNDYCK